MKISRKICILATGAALISGCGNKTEPATSDLIIRIGSVAPLTGPQAALGKDNDNGARLAVDEINAAGLTIGGRKAKVELVSEDDQADPKTATIVAQKLVDQKVNGIVGDLNSGTTIPASKIYSDAGIPQISPSATAVAYTAQGFKTAFRVMANDSQQGKALADFATGNLKAKTVAIIDDRTAYGQGLADEFAKNATASGAKVVAREYTNDKATDFTAVLTSIKARNPDLLMFAGMDTQGGPMMKQIRNLGLKVQFLSGDGSRNAEFISLAGDASEGAYASSPGLPLDQMNGGREFVAKFEGKYGKIQLYAPYAYDATLTLIEAMKKADSADPAKYLPLLSQIERNGVIGPIGFDQKGDLKGGAVTIYQVKNGTWVALPR